MKRLKNQHFVQYIGSYTTVRSLDLIMTPVADCTLAEYMEELGTTASDSTLQSFFGCLATSIAYLHTNRIKHGCIKPNDILIHRSSVFIADFEDSLDFSDVDVSYIEEGPDPIAPRYASPEIAAMEAPGTPADIWALGCVFLEM
ncbi:kinase-like protein, partial [Decorospora gaudefroyi]